MIVTDEQARDLLRRGYFYVDPDGTVWRMMTKSRTGRPIATAPTRADRIDKSTGYRRVRVGKRGLIQAYRRRNRGGRDARQAGRNRGFRHARHIAQDR